MLLTMLILILRRMPEKLPSMQAVPVEEEIASQAAELHYKTAQNLHGVDKPRDSDEFFRLEMERCFYVGGMDNLSQAESLTKEDYR